MDNESSIIPTFSIVIPAYNRSSTILPTLLSVRNQTFEDFECIVVDDGSDDGSELESLIHSLEDNRFIYVKRENGGGGAARNTGVAVSRGRFIAFLDSDDLFLDSKLAECVKYIVHNPSLVYYSYILVDRGVGKYWRRPDRPIGNNEDVGEYLFVSNQFIQTSTIVMSRDIALRVPFDNSLRKGQDLDLCVRLSSYGYSFKMIENPLIVWVDKTEVGRTSRVSGADAPVKWLDANKGILTEKAYLGYRTNVLAYYIGWNKPYSVIKDLYFGYSKAGIPLKVIVRQFCRCFLPRTLYRSMVGGYVRAFGRK